MSAVAALAAPAAAPVAAPVDTAVLPSAPAPVGQVRRRPIPVREPFAAVRVLQPTPAGTPGQEALVLPMGSPVAGVEDVVPDPPDGPSLDRAVRRAGRAPGAHGPAREGSAGSAVDAAEPDVLRWASQFVQAAVEVAAGLRSPSQLARWTTDGVREGLAQRGALNRRAPGRGPARRTVVRSVHASHPTPGVTEACAVVADGRRLRAVALRMDVYQGRWRVTALQIG